MPSQEAEIRREPIILNLSNMSNAEIRQSILSTVQQVAGNISPSKLRYRLCKPELIPRVFAHGTDRDRYSDSSTVPFFEGEPERVTWTHTADVFFSSKHKFAHSYYPDLEGVDTGIIIYKPDNIRELYPDGTCIFERKPSSNDVVAVIHLMT